jgi:hypothetical protein
MLIERPRDPDWCHLCGRRSAEVVHVLYPDNAELYRLWPSHRIRSTGRERGIRICRSCARRIFQIAGCPAGTTLETLLIDSNGR